MMHQRTEEPFGVVELNGGWCRGQAFVGVAFHILLGENGRRLMGTSFFVLEYSGVDFL